MTVSKRPSEEVRSIVPVMHVALELTNVAGRMGLLEEEIIQVLQQHLGEKYGIVGGKAYCDGYGPAWYHQQLPNRDDDDYEELLAAEREANEHTGEKEWRYPDVTHVTTEQLADLAKELGIGYPSGAHPSVVRLRLVIAICQAAPNAISQRYPV